LRPANGQILTKKYRDGKNKMPKSEHRYDCFYGVEYARSLSARTPRDGAISKLNKRPAEIDGCDEPVKEEKIAGLEQN